MHSNQTQTMKKFFVAALALFLALSGFTAALPPKGEAEHVVLVVWDGMRPDFITPQYTPTLYALATNGVFFKNHHSSYISSTEVNGAAIATGCYPEHSGIYANNDYRPALGWMGPNATEGLDTIRRGDFLTKDHYLLVPTCAEILQQAGFPTVVAGAKPVILLHDRSAKRSKGAAKSSVNLYRGQTLPKAALETFEDKQIPTNNPSSKDIDNWTTKSLTQSLWKKGVPKYSVLWLSDPDATQHAKGPGHEDVIACLSNCDKNLEAVLKALKDKKALDKTDLIIASDHGFSTIRRGVEVADVLKKAKFKASRRFEDPERGEVLVVGHGGSTSLYVCEHDPKVIQELVTFLQGSDFAGVIFTRAELPGTFPMSAARIAAPNVMPDIVFSMRWWPDLNDNGAPGWVVSDGGGKGGGTHASLSRFDMHNICVANGPDFKQGLVNELPSGSVDLAPTTLWILGVDQPFKTPMDGRVLSESLLKGPAPEARPDTKTLETTRDLGWLRWKQYLKFTQFGRTLYFDEGNGACEMK